MFPGFKIYRPSIYEMPDEYNQVLTNDQMRIILLEFLSKREWSGKTYRAMYRELYKKTINPNYEF